MTRARPASRADGAGSHGMRSSPRRWMSRVVKGLASTTVRDVAARMGTSSRAHPPLLRVDGRGAGRGVRASSRRRILGCRRGSWPRRHRRSRRFGSSSGPTRRPIRTGRSSSGSTPGPRQLAVPPVQATSRRLNLEWQALLERTIRAGVDRRGVPVRRSGAAAAWRILSLLDGLALQVVAHGTTITRADVVAWSTAAAERELGLARGVLALATARTPRPAPPGA